MQHLLDIITSTDNDLPNINPTQIYNEGWMTRLLMKQSILEKTNLKEFDFGKFNNWTSEALISSPFLNAKECNEGYTHADIAFGDCTVDYIKSGKLEIEKESKIFGIIEAKMKSGLSKGTKNHPNAYNQSSRTVTCISENTHNKQNCDIYFIVVAPRKKLMNIAHKFEKHFLIDQIKKRFGKSEKSNNK